MRSPHILTAGVTNVGERWYAATTLKFPEECQDSLDEILYGRVILNV